MDKSGIRAETLEKQILSLKEDHGVAIESYNSIDDFLRNNV